KGDGTFQRAPDIRATGDTYSVALTDLNGDGLPDVIAANHSSQTVAVALGLGGGQFRSPINLSSSPTWIAPTMQGRERTLPIAVTNSLANSVVVLGEGVQVLGTYSVGDTPKQVVWADFNHDGIADLATINSGSGDVSILLGDSNGGFHPELTIPAGKI